MCYNRPMRITIKRVVTGLFIMGLVFTSPVFYSIGYGETDLSQLNIDDDSYYYLENYRSSDCVLSANAYMIMRALYFDGSKYFEGVTNNSLRKVACTSRNGSSLKYEYSYERDGLRYDVVHDYLGGSAADKKSKLKKLLKKHPEGIVVYGSSRYGIHGVLLTDYENGKFYAVDSAQNKSGRNLGILRFDNTTMNSIGSLSHIWYIDNTGGFSKSNLATIKVDGMNLADGYQGWTLTWDLDDTDVKLGGYNISYISEEDYDAGESFTLLAQPSERTVFLSDYKDGKTYFFKIRGYRRDLSGKKIHTRYSTIAVRMSDPKNPEAYSGMIEEPDTKR